MSALVQQEVMNSPAKYNKSYSSFSRLPASMTVLAAIFVALLFVLISPANAKTVGRIPSSEQLQLSPAGADVNNALMTRIVRAYPSNFRDSALTAFEEPQQGFDYGYVLVPEENILTSIKRNSRGPRPLRFG